MQTSFVVPARSGSKRLRDKNTRLLAGKPLLFHTLDACLGHAQTARVILTTDSPEYIALVHDHYGDAVTCVRRPDATAGDRSKVTDEVRRLLVESPELFDGPWFGVCLPTAPLRTHDVVRKALSRWEETERPLFSAMQYDFPVQFAFRIDSKGDWQPLLGEDSPMMSGQTRSQDIEPLYRPNGAIYLQRRDIFLSSGVFYHQAMPFLMTAEESVDVDTLRDFRFAELLLRAPTA